MINVQAGATLTLNGGPYSHGYSQPASFVPTTNGLRVLYTHADDRPIKFVSYTLQDKDGNVLISAPLPTFIQGVFMSQGCLLDFRINFDGSQPAIAGGPGEE